MMKETTQLKIAVAVGLSLLAISITLGATWPTISWGYRGGLIVVGALVGGLLGFGGGVGTFFLLDEYDLAKNRDDRREEERKERIKREYDEMMKEQNK